jgi:cell cycle protein kinase DBF2
LEEFEALERGFEATSLGGPELLYQQSHLELYHEVCASNRMKRPFANLYSCIASKTKRFSSIKDVYEHQYFAEVDWKTLRSQRAPFVPELDSETDAGYFDDFSNEADMAKYKEVHEKQTALENMADREDPMSKSLFVGFTFRHRKPTTEEGGKSSPRKPIATDGTFGTML